MSQLQLLSLTAQTQIKGAVKKAQTTQNYIKKGTFIRFELPQIVRTVQKETFTVDKIKF